MDPKSPEVMAAYQRIQAQKHDWLRRVAENHRRFAQYCEGKGRRVEFDPGCEILVYPGDELKKDLKFIRFFSI